MNFNEFVAHENFIGLREFLDAVSVCEIRVTLKCSHHRLILLLSTIFFINYESLIFTHNFPLFGSHIIFQNF